MWLPMCVVLVQAHHPALTLPIQCELYYWIDVLDRFDVILEEASKDEQDTPTDCIFMCPKLMEPQVLSTCHTYTTVLCRN